MCHTILSQYGRSDAAQPPLQINIGRDARAEVHTNLHDDSFLRSCPMTVGHDFGVGDGEIDQVRDPLIEQAIRVTRDTFVETNKWWASDPRLVERRHLGALVLSTLPLQSN